MSQIFAIASNTFKETIRDRVLAVIIVFALIMIVAALWLASISLGEQGRMMKDFGLLAVTAFGLIVTVFVAAGLVHKEVEKRTVFVLFTKPVGRGSFVFGKFLGLCCTMAVVLLGMGVFLFLLVLLVAHEATWLILLATLMIYLQLVTVMAVTLFFSTFASSILAAVLGMCVFVAGQLSHNVLSLTTVSRGVSAKVLSWVVYVLVPNFSAVDIKAAVVGEQMMPAGQLLLWSGYLVAYIVVALALAAVVFRRKEF